MSARNPDLRRTDLVAGLTIYESSTDDARLVTGSTDLDHHGDLAEETAVTVEELEARKRPLSFDLEALLQPAHTIERHKSAIQSGDGIMDTYILAIDRGSTNLKLVLFNQKGEQLHLVSMPN